MKATTAGAGRDFSPIDPLSPGREGIERMTVELLVADLDFATRFAMHRNSLAAASGVVIVQWTTKQIVELFVSMQCEAARLSTMETIKALGPLPAADDAKASAVYAKRALAWGEGGRNAFYRRAAEAEARRARNFSVDSLGFERTQKRRTTIEISQADDAFIKALAAHRNALADVSDVAVRRWTRKQLTELFASMQCEAARLALAPMIEKFGPLPDKKKDSLSYARRVLAD